MSSETLDCVWVALLILPVNWREAVAQDRISAFYDSFGNLTASTGSLTNPFRYTARESDTETGLYYYRARYYDPNIGRFLSEDPAGFRADVDFYRYVHNRSVDFVDPSGLN